jgi:hypothetical protein
MLIQIILSLFIIPPEEIANKATPVFRKHQVAHKILPDALKQSLHEKNQLKKQHVI